MALDIVAVGAATLEVINVISSTIANSFPATISIFVDEHTTSPPYNLACTAWRSVTFEFVACSTVDWWPVEFPWDSVDFLWWRRSEMKMG